MNTDRVLAHLQLLTVMDGGPLPDPAALAGLTTAEKATAEDLYAAGLDADRAHRALRAVQLAYLIRHAPGAPSIDEALARLSPQQCTEFDALTEGDL